MVGFSNLMSLMPNGGPTMPPGWQHGQFPPASGAPDPGGGLRRFGAGFPPTNQPPIYQPPMGSQYGGFPPASGGPVFSGPHPGLNGIPPYINQVGNQGGNQGGGLGQIGGWGGNGGWSMGNGYDGSNFGLLQQLMQGGGNGYGGY